MPFVSAAINSESTTTESFRMKRGNCVFRFGDIGAFFLVVGVSTQECMSIAIGTGVTVRTMIHSVRAS